MFLISPPVITGLGAQGQVHLMICRVLFEGPEFGRILDLDEWHPGPHGLESPTFVGICLQQENDRLEYNYFTLISQGPSIVNRE